MRVPSNLFLVAIFTRFSQRVFMVQRYIKNLAFANLSPLYFTKNLHINTSEIDRCKRFSKLRNYLVFAEILRKTFFTTIPQIFPSLGIKMLYFGILQIVQNFQNNKKGIKEIV